MDYTAKKNKIILKSPKSFNIKEILECGQVFRFFKLEENNYKIIAFGKALNVKQNTDVEFFPCTSEEFENIWIDYFDLERDYCSIKEELSKDDPVMEKAVNSAPGIRLLRQEPYECLISFIISQNNRIPMIQKVIENLSKKFGEPISAGEFYTFPKVERLNQASLDDIISCKTGFRAKYIKDACQKIVLKEIDIDNLKNLSESDAGALLKSIYGVGQKVADCVLLMALGKYAAFPTDVWVRRIMEELYFDKKQATVQRIHGFAREKWGDSAGFAQQYLFNYARENKIGK